SPVATHPRFDHALGPYHLARSVLGLLEDHPDYRAIDPLDCALIRVAALLHDIGHYPFSHALEEIGALHHEAVARPLIVDGEVAAVLRPERRAAAPPRRRSLVLRGCRGPAP